MSVAEYIASFISIMIGLSLADLATSLQRLLRAGKRVRWDILTPATAILVTAFVINVWWSLYGALNAMRSLSVAGFVPDLISLILLFCLTSSALPDDVADGCDLGEYYRTNRKRFWGLFLIYMLWVTAVIGVRGSLAGGGSALIGSVVPNLLLAALMLLLVFTPRRSIHLAVVALLLAVTGFAWLPQQLGRLG